MSLALIALLACGPGSQPVTVAPAPAPIAVPADGMSRYTLGFADASRNLVDVEGVIPTAGAERFDLMMATWTPGSYLVREYARNVEGVAVDPPATVAKTAKNRWTVTTGGAGAVRVRYRVYARELAVNTCFVDADLGMLNGACVFAVRADALDRPIEVALTPPEGWSVQTALDPVDGQPNTWRARDYDELVDSPILGGALTVHPFEIDGVEHRLVEWGDDDVWDGERAARDVAAIAREATEMWGVIPYDRYVFLNVIAEAGGGLEHERSTLMLTSRWKSASRSAHQEWLGLVSHEFFHTWNVKRMRPVELGPFDYEREVLTENLWIAEGFTSYYDDLLLARAGLIDETEWLKRTGNNIRQLQTTPGRLVHPLSETSRDAWIKHYRRDENSKNTTISYYTKGAVVGFLLDARIREETGGDRSLDDVMRTAYARFSGDRGYTSAEFRAVASEVARTDLDPFFASAVDGTDELSYDDALAWYGLRFAEVPASGPKEGEPDETPGWAGLELDGGNRVSGVERGTPAWEAGFNVGDEVLAANGLRVGNGGWGDREKRYRPGTELEVLIARRDALRTLRLTLGKAPEAGWTLEAIEDAPPTAVERRKRLLGID